MVQNRDRLAGITSGAGRTQNDATSATTTPKSVKTRFRHALAGYLSLQDKTGTGAETRLGMLNMTPSQLMEKMQRDSNAMQLRLLTELSRKDDKSNDVDAQSKCLTIAMRILRGDKVPAKDMKFLLQNNPGLYFQAMMFRREKEDPEVYESITDDEDDEEVQ